MKKQYIKPDLHEYQVINAPLMDASYGEGYADPDQQVLSKRHRFYDFTDDTDDEDAITNN